MIEKIIQKLDDSGFPDFSFFTSSEILEKTPEVLEELLEREKKFFSDLIKKENSILSFDDLEDDSLLDYFWSILNHLENTNSSKTIRNIIEDFRPKLEDFSNEVSYSKPYFEKLVYIRDNLELDSDQKRILELSIKSYKDRGIDLDTEKQEELKAINKKLSELSHKFTNNIVDDKALFSYEIEDFEIIKELPKEVLEKARNAYNSSFKGEEKQAENKENNFNDSVSSTEGQQSCSMNYELGTKYLFDADPTSQQAIMKYCSSVKVRKDFEVFSYSVASKGKYDNRAVVLEILSLKEKKAKILGYKNYAELSLNSKMASSPEQIFSLISNISKKAKIKAKKELEELKKYFSLDKLETYDVAYYSRKLKEEKYSLDEEKLKRYFELDSVLDYMFSFVEKFYNLEIRPLPNPPLVGEGNENNIVAYEVWKDSKLISYYFIDLFYRKEKRPGAWANNLRSKYVPKNKIPVVLNVCNFAKNIKGKTLLYLRDVETIFHEFGHALHEMLSESKYSELSGFGVEWDFVELPSQLMENWVSEKESMKKFARDFETGEVISDDLIGKLEDLKHFMSGNFVARQNEFALLDMSIYSEKAPNSVEELDKKSLELVNKYSIFNRGDDYKMYASFGHIFGGGYAAGYYSYMWAEILEADLFARIKEMGMFKRETGEKLLKTIIGAGCRKKAGELFFDFMGREVDDKAFMERYGIGG